MKNLILISMVGLFLVAGGCCPPGNEIAVATEAAEESNSNLTELAETRSGYLTVYNYVDEDRDRDCLIATNLWNGGVAINCKEKNQ